ncbi:MAG TPA: hypothetical protein VI524_07290 [Anaerolineales bacterium]|nr:hypothetical protein [Anaerolineales bacterium]
MMRRWLALAGVLLIAALLAFPLRQAVHDAIVVPGAYLLWVLGLVYRSLSQGIWWLIVILLVLLILGRSLAPPLPPPGRMLAKSRPPRGQVEDLADWLNKSGQGMYFKWLVANRLGKLAYQILWQRGRGKTRSVFEPLAGPDWEPAPDLQRYLESGLQGSFADFPNPRKLLASPGKTPLDYRVDEAVDFLESQMHQSHHR